MTKKVRSSWMEKMERNGMLAFRGDTAFPDRYCAAIGHEGDSPNDRCFQSTSLFGFGNDDHVCSFEDIIFMWPGGSAG